MNLRILAGFIAILIVQCAFSQQKIDVALEKIVQRPEYKNALFGIHVKNLNTGETLFSWNGNKRMIPASTLKIITSATALEILGIDYRFVTQVGYSGKIKEKILKGDLVIVGGGDPTMGSEYFLNDFQNRDFLNIWSQRIKATGISRIEGDLILDGSFYDSEKIPPTWIWEDIGNYYGAGASALTVYDNLFRITFSSSSKAGKPTKIISVNPEIKGLQIQNEVISANSNRDEAYVFGSPLDKVRKITGTIPKNRKSFTIKAAVQHPEELLAAALIHELAKDGVFISGKVRFQKADKGKMQVIYIQESPELKEIITVLNHKSINLFAEHLLKQLAAEKNGVGNRQEGIDIIKDFWKSKGINSDALILEDGSGLSHFNAVAPEQFTEIMDFMYNKSSNKEAFLSSLPASGEGTLSGFSTTRFPGNTLLAKSGSMSGVQCYSGYLRTDSGQTNAFSIMVNHFTGSSINLIEELENLMHIIKISF